jgi:catechol 2,3-dioxygenase-like lactoylglutathione lyase family enzyme
MNENGHVRLAHVGVYVRDIERLRGFYTRALGLVVTDQEVSEKRQIVFLSRNPEEHHQLVLVGGRPAAEEFNVVNQISFKVEELAAVQSCYGRLGSEPVTEIRPVTHGIAWSVYFRDPEGNRVEVFADTPWYVRQPYGSPIDLTRPADDLVRDTEALCRTLPGYRPRDQWRAELQRRLAQPARA